MQRHTRYAIYYVPPDGPLASFGAAWLGWDIATARDVPQPELPGLAEVTAAPRKYGFHGTLKAPFWLAEGQSLSALSQALDQLARTTPAAHSGPLELTALGRFLALVPTEPRDGLARVASACVTELDRFRAPLTDAELARRRSGHLTPRQDALLLRWGYPRVLDQFHFHLTLTGRLPKAHLPAWQRAAQDLLPPPASTFTLDQIALAGERPDGRFETLETFSLHAG